MRQRLDDPVSVIYVAPSLEKAQSAEVVRIVYVVTLIALLIWPAIILICIFTFRGAIIKVLSAAHEAEISSHGIRWRRNLDSKKTDDAKNDVRMVPKRKHVPGR